MSKQAAVINISNFKGGTGKSTTTVGVAHELAKKGLKVLVVDFDPQADATAFLLPRENWEEYPTVYEAFQTGDLRPAIYSVNEHLDIVASDFDLVGLQIYLNKYKNLKNRASVLKEMIDPLRAEYDYIFIDVPPTLSDNANNALVASDYVVISLQTHGTALRAAQKYLPYIGQMMEYFNDQLELIGILPVIHSKGAKSDLRIIEQANEMFGDVLFDTTILYRERIKSWGETGIRDIEGDHWDKEALRQYEAFGLELIERINASRLEAAK